MRTLSTEAQTESSLPIGFKLHCSIAQPHLAQMFRTEQYFNAHGLRHTYILPPFCTVGAALQTLESLADQAGLPLLDNPDVLIQVCHPARLTKKRAAILATVFFATSDYIRAVPPHLHTTHDSYTNVRPVIYDYDPTSCDRDFPWLASLQPWRMISFSSLGVWGRTDILTVQSAHEIRTLNFVATLLVHHQHDGAWKHFGDKLIQDVTRVLQRQQLAALLNISWVAETSSHAETETFQLCFLEFLDIIAREANFTTHQSGVRSEISHIIRTLEKGITSCTKQFSPAPIPH